MRMRSSSAAWRAPRSRSRSSCSLFASSSRLQRGPGRAPSARRAAAAGRRRASARRRPRPLDRGVEGDPRRDEPRRRRPRRPPARVAPPAWRPAVYSAITAPRAATRVPDEEPVERGLDEQRGHRPPQHGQRAVRRSASGSVTNGSASALTRRLPSGRPEQHLELTGDRQRDGRQEVQPAGPHEEGGDRAHEGQGNARSRLRPRARGRTGPPPPGGDPDGMLGGVGCCYRLVTSRSQALMLRRDARRPAENRCTAGVGRLDGGARVGRVGGRPGPSAPRLRDHPADRGRHARGDAHRRRALRHRPARPRRRRRRAAAAGAGPDPGLLRARRRASRDPRRPRDLAAGDAPDHRARARPLVMAAARVRPGLDRGVLHHLRRLPELQGLPAARCVRRSTTASCSSSTARCSSATTRRRVMHKLLGTGVAQQVLSTVYVLFLAFVPISLAVALVWFGDSATGCGTRRPVHQLGARRPQLLPDAVDGPGLRGAGAVRRPGADRRRRRCSTRCSGGAAQACSTARRPGRRGELCRASRRSPRCTCASCSRPR